MADSIWKGSLPRCNIEGEIALGMESQQKQVDEGFADYEPTLDIVESGVADCLVSKTSGQDSDSGRGTESGSDPWELPEFVDDSMPWNDLSAIQKWRRVLLEWIGRAVALVVLLYFFICSLDFLSSAFRLLGGKAAGAAFSNSALLQNPVAGLMIGVLATVLVQSSSTSTSIVVTMVASGIIEVPPAIPIIMGANIGTSVTNTIVSLSQSSDREQFRRAFAGATVHDMFNWLSVLVLLPLEVATGYLYRLTRELVKHCPNGSGGSNTNLLKTLTKPFTTLVIQLDKKMVEKIAIGEVVSGDGSLIKQWCKYTLVEVPVNVTETKNMSITIADITRFNQVNLTSETLQNQSVPVAECQFLFHNTGMSDALVGSILLVFSLVMLCGCLVLMVKVLNSLLRGKMAGVVKKTLNADFPGKLSYFTGYFVMLVGAVMTMLVQSSSVFTSAVTPLVGVGLLRMERMYPLTLGANIGTTTTGLLAAMAASSDKLQLALQIALCHLFFNLSGIIVFYVIPQMRVPVSLAKIMGNTTAKYRWFAVFYLVMMFFVLPAFVFVLSMAGTVVFSAVGSVIMLFFAFVVLLNVLQRKVPKRLPKRLRTWDFLPFECMHSLDPLDRVINAVVSKVRSCCCCCKKPQIPVTLDTYEPQEKTSIPTIELSPSEKSLLMKEVREHVHVPTLEFTEEDKLDEIRSGLESGYITAAPTPCITVQNSPETTPYGPTPCVSRVHSYARIPSRAKIEEGEAQNAAPASQPSPPTVRVSFDIEAEGEKPSTSKTESKRSEGSQDKNDDGHSS